MLFITQLTFGFICSIVFLRKKTVDLSKLTICPDALPYNARISITLEASWTSTLQHNIESSTKSRCEIIGLSLQIFNPVNAFWFTASFNKLESTLAHVIKKIRWQKVTLSNTSGRFDKANFFTIEIKGVRNSGNAIHNPTHKDWAETHF